jgi:predicted SprT family Zn-dependent metalloprotease
VESRAAGACKFSPEGGCEIRLSEPVLKLRTTADLKKTLLHEMIHAYIFSTTGNKDHEDHGPSFQYLMRSINQFSMDDDQRPENGYNISVCHNFEDDMDVDQCEKCGDSVKRSRNEAPSVSDCLRDGTCVPSCESCPDSISHWHKLDFCAFKARLF